MQKQRLPGVAAGVPVSVKNINMLTPVNEVVFPYYKIIKFIDKITLFVDFM